MPTATRMITEPTPIISPRIVSPERSLFADRPAERDAHGLGHDDASTGFGGVADDVPVGELDDALGVGGDLVLVGDQDDRAALVGEALEDARGPPAWRRVEVPGRLVGEDHRRVGDQRPRDGDALLLAARELGGEVVHAAARPTSASARMARRWRSARLTPGVGERQLDVGQRARARDEVEALEDEADLAVAQVGELVLVGAADVEAVEPVDAAGRHVQAAEDVHQRALAAARAAHDRDVLAATRSSQVIPLRACTAISPSS